MPKKLLSCVEKVKRKDVRNPWAICIASTGQYPHSKKGKRRLTK